MARFVHEGKSIDYTPGAAVAAGTLVVLGGILGFTSRNIEANRLGALAVEGVFDEAKDASVFAIGDKVYWNPTGDPVGGTAGSGAMTITPTATSVFVGIALAAAATGASQVRFALTGHNSTPRLAVATVAAAGSVQGDAAALIEGMNVVSGANGTVGVRLPTAAPGMQVHVKGATAGVLKVYPATGAAINAIAANGAMSLASGLIPAIFVATSATQWVTIPLVPS